MDFELSHDQKFFRDQVVRTLETLVLPCAAEIDSTDIFPETLFRELGRLGYYGIRYPVELGGMGADCVTFTIFANELARVSIGFAATVTMQCLMGTNFLFRFGTEEQKKRLLMPAIRGEKMGVIAFTEPDCGSDLGAIRTTARKEGEGYRLKGRKLWITNADRADFFTVAATTDPSQRVKGIGFFLVEKGCSGFSLGRKIPKISARGAEAAELIFDDCFLPKENLLGEEGDGALYLTEILSEIRIMMAALGLGLSQAARAAGLKYAKEREAFGRPIGKFQLIEEKIAEMEVRIETARLLTYYTAWLKDRGRLGAKDAALAKLHATETACYVVDEVTRIHGAYGIAEEFPAQRFFRDARFLLFGGGTSEILKTVIAAEKLRHAGP